MPNTIPVKQTRGLLQSLRQQRAEPLHGQRPAAELGLTCRRDTATSPRSAASTHDHNNASDLFLILDFYWQLANS